MIKTKPKNLVLNKKLEERCPKGRLTSTQGNGVTEISHTQTDTGRKEKVLWKDIHTEGLSYVIT
jgi:hypothetical protein